MHRWTGRSLRPVWAAAAPHERRAGCGAVAAGSGRRLVIGAGMGQSNPIKVGIATDLTGPIGFAGNANAQRREDGGQATSTPRAGSLGRSLQLFIEDTASNESVAVNNVRKLIQRDQRRRGVRRHHQLDAQRDQGRDRDAGADALHLSRSSTRARSARRSSSAPARPPPSSATSFIPWLIKNGGKRFALPSANYVWPKLLNKYARKVIEANGGEVVFEEYYPLDQVEYSATVNKIMTTR